MSRAGEILRRLLVSEGINDKNLFKAIILAGSAGSGKSFVLDSLVAKKGAVSALGAVVINSDTFFEKKLLDLKLPMKFDPDNKEVYAKQMAARDVAKKLTATKLSNILNGMLPVVIDGTGRDSSKIISQKEALENLGYDVHMVFVNTSLKVALERNRSRTRSLPDDQVTKMWDKVNGNLGSFQSQFKGNLLIIDNNKNLNKKETTSFSLDVFKKGSKILSTALKNPRGVAMLAFLRATGGKTVSDASKIELAQE